MEAFDPAVVRPWQFHNRARSGMDGRLARCTRELDQAPWTTATRARAPVTQGRHACRRGNLRRTPARGLPPRGRGVARGGTGGRRSRMRSAPPPCTERTPGRKAFRRSRTPCNGSPCWTRGVFANQSAPGGRDRLPSRHRIASRADRDGPVRGGVARTAGSPGDARVHGAGGRPSGGRVCGRYTPQCRPAPRGATRSRNGGCRSTLRRAVPRAAHEAPPGSRLRTPQGPRRRRRGGREDGARRDRRVLDQRACPRTVRGGPRRTGRADRGRWWPARRQPPPPLDSAGGSWHHCRPRRHAMPTVPGSKAVSGRPARASGLEWDRLRCAVVAEGLRRQREGWELAVVRAVASTDPDAV